MTAQLPTAKLPLSRRTFCQKMTATIGSSLAATSCWARPLGANDDIRAAVVGLNGFGRRHIQAYQQMEGVRLVALCDVDSSLLALRANKLRKQQQSVATYTDLRELLDQQDVDVISVVTPNHWHALATIWACQAGKDVHVEKPISHNLFESRQMVAAARKYDRIVQSGMEARSHPGLRQAVDYIQQGKLGRVLVVRAFVYKRRESMGLVTQPQDVPKSIDYNLWSGPAPLEPLMRQNFHYDWHWQWDYGNGAIGNNGAHMLDIVRFALGDPKLPTRTMHFGGRYGYVDNGETPNTNVALFEFDSVPVIFEARALGRKTNDPASDAYRAVAENGLVMRSGEPSPRPKTGVMVQCEGGYVDLAAYRAYDNQGRERAQFHVEQTGLEHDENFLAAVRSRQASDLNGEIEQGHYSVALSHLANISYRVGDASSPQEIRDSIASDHGAVEALGRFESHLSANQVDLNKTPVIQGPWLTVDPETEQLIGPFAERANRYVSREYRKPFEVPKNV